MIHRTCSTPHNPQYICKPLIHFIFFDESVYVNEFDVSFTWQWYITPFPSVSLLHLLFRCEVWWFDMQSIYRREHSFWTYINQGVLRKHNEFRWQRPKHHMKWSHLLVNSYCKEYNRNLRKTITQPRSTPHNSESSVASAQMPTSLKETLFSEPERDLTLCRRRTEGCSICRCCIWWILIPWCFFQLFLIQNYRSFC